MPLFQSEIETLSYYASCLGCDSCTESGKLYAMTDYSY